VTVAAVTPPLLESVDPQLEGTALALGQLSASGPLLVLVGAWGPLFDLIAGTRRLRGGRLLLAGVPAEGAAADASVGLARRDAPLPPTWTATEVLVASAELIGQSRRRAGELARQAIGELGLEAIAGKRLSRSSPAERRAVSIAAATLGAPRVLALEEPFADLEPSGQAYVEALIARAVTGRPAIVSVPELPGSPSAEALAARSQELLFLSGQRWVARGSYRDLSSRARSYRVVVTRSVDALLSGLVEAGYEVRPMLTRDVTTLWLTDVTGIGTVPLFRAALAADAPVVELVALGLAGSDGLGARQLTVPAAPAEPGSPAASGVEA
jgi:ABC-type multidrug transport system ATPase subunit